MSTPAGPRDTDVPAQGAQPFILPGEAATSPALASEDRGQGPALDELDAAVEEVQPAPRRAPQVAADVVAQGPPHRRRARAQGRPGRAGRLGAVRVDPPRKWGVPMRLQWTTTDEVDYVKGLGQHCLGPQSPERREQPTRFELLASYLRSMERRSAWGDVDPDQVRAVVERELGEELKARAAFVPTNGHGLCAARQYAKPVSEARMEIRRTEEGEEE
jgi:hypothetical protein